MKRTFVAVPIPLLPQLGGFATNIKHKLYREKINWVNLNSLHITLFFLGDTRETHIPQIGSVLKDSLSTVSAFEINLKGTGCFSRKGIPQVIWVGIDNYSPLSVLKSVISNDIEKFGYMADKRIFKPHLTLGRIKYLKNKQVLFDMIENNNTKDFGTVKINEIIFFESELTGSGPIYNSLEKISLQQSIRHGL